MKATADASALVLETQILESQETHEHVSVAQEDVQNVPPPEKRKRVPKEPVTLVREAGKSLLPFSREIPIVAKDATFLISLATEEFIRRLTEAGKMVAEREKRATVQHKDIATVVRRADEFLFLEGESLHSFSYIHLQLTGVDWVEIIPWVSADPPAKRKLRNIETASDREQQSIHQFVVNTNRAEDKEVSEPADIVMNEDGTMGIQGGDSDQDDFE
ncbi:hypothetical protein C0993_012422 [Termitomyces sp. T159_Od127]|nr:hypothetical protein C0993_012422 [Termitomyces sp. T159_Od127]